MIWGSQDSAESFGPGLACSALLANITYNARTYIDNGQLQNGTVIVFQNT